MKERSSKNIFCSALALGFLCISASTPMTANAAKETTPPESSQIKGLTSPKPAEMSQRSKEELAQERIYKEKAEADRMAKTKAVVETVVALEEAQLAVRLIEEKNNEKATAALERAVGKLDVILAAQPQLALLPIGLDIRVIDFVADVPTVKAVARRALTLMSSNEIQNSRRVLIPFASELTFSTVAIPTATYPFAIKQAVRLLHEGKAEEAKTELMVALNSLVRTDRSIPLPVIRAQALVDEVNRQIKEGNVNKPEANQLLEDATTQLMLAEEFGYGTRKKEFQGLQTSIKQLKKSLNENKDSKSLMTKIVDELKAVKEKIF